MNKQLQVRTLSSFTRAVATAQSADDNASQTLNEKRHALNQAKGELRLSPGDDYAKAKVQAAEQEYNTALTARGIAKEALRKANEAKRIFVYQQKPSYSQHGRTLRH